MNKLPLEKRIQIVRCLVEGNSVRGTARLCNVVKNTVLKLLCEVGEAVWAYHDETLINLNGRRWQLDEIWSFVGAKQKNVSEHRKGSAGDIWTWVALDADSKLVGSFYVGGRGSDSAIAIADDLAKRLANRVQITTDGHKAYLEAVEGAFGGDVDYAQLVKLYGAAPESAKGKYSPAECVGARKARVEGNPDMVHVSTSYVERQNRTMRMGIRRFTRLTDAFSKKVENHAFAVALHFAYYNFCRVHQTLRITPAMAAGVTKSIMDVADLIRITDEYWSIKVPPKPRGPYKKREQISK